MISKKKIIIAGGSGFIGSLMQKYLDAEKYDLHVLSRVKHSNIPTTLWDGKSLGSWTSLLEGSEAVFNLSGKSINCQHTPSNIDKLIASRVSPTSIIAKAISACKTPPKMWFNSSGIGIYTPGYGAIDENGPIGNGYMADMVQKWEAPILNTMLPKTRKIIGRTGVVLEKSGGMYPVVAQLAKMGLGGKQGSGKQFFSWIHGKDLIKIFEFFIENNTCEGVFNLCAPNAVTNKVFNQSLRKSLGCFFGIDQPAFLLKIGAALINTEAELALTSYNVYPKALIDKGFCFNFDTIDTALTEI